MFTFLFIFYKKEQKKQVFKENHKTHLKTFLLLFEAKNHSLYKYFAV